MLAILRIELYEFAPVICLPRNPRTICSPSFSVLLQCRHSLERVHPRVMYHFATAAAASTFSAYAHTPSIKADKSMHYTVTPTEGRSCCCHHNIAMSFETACHGKIYGCLDSETTFVNRP